MVLLALGGWQLDRLAWKTDLLARIEAAEAGPATPLGPEPPAFTKVTATGRFDHAREVQLGLEVRGTTLGAQLLTPLLRDGAPPLLVDRGWVPVARTTPLPRPEGPVTVTGWIRAPEPRGDMAAIDDTAGRRFWTFDPVAIGAAVGLPVEPFALVVLAAPGDPVLPAASRAMPRPRNPHLGYAITWFGLAAALVGVLVAFLLTRRRQPGSPACPKPPLLA